MQSKFGLNRTRMTRIGRISTDPCASASSAQSVLYHTIFLSVLIEDAWRSLNCLEKKHVRPDYSIILDWIKKDSSVLDLGCHEGDLLSLIVKEKNARAHGIEIDEQAIYKCVELGLSVSHQDIDNGLSEYGDESFDYVILNQSIQQVKKPDIVLKESLRVGKEVIIGFPNFAHFRARCQIFFRGKTPITPSLPYEWYETPNLHFLSISDFRDYCKRQDIRIKRSAFFCNDRMTGMTNIVPNLLAQNGLFLISK
jgi:methionine biosynthesis protein MetW